jgi:phosphate transport system substrate-binding protein
MSLARRSTLLLLAAAYFGALAGPLAAQETVSLVGSGSNLAGALYTAWTAEYGKSHSGMQVRFLPLGTAESIKEIKQGKGDFGGGELPLADSQKHAGSYTLLQFPTALVAIVPIYNLPGKPELRFNGELLAGIFLGTVSNWNDPRIAKLNPGVGLPDLKISVVHLSGVKGSSYILTDFLSRTSPAWKAKIGKSASPDWPVGEEVNRSEGLVTKIGTTPGAFGYVELTYAKRKDIGYGSVLNATGQYVKASNASTAAACAASEKNLPTDLGASLANAPGKDSYPITSFTWIYVPASGLPQDRSRVLKGFWTWALTNGQEIAGRLGYAELPASIAAKSREVVDSIH